MTPKSPIEDRTTSTPPLLEKEALTKFQDMRRRILSRDCELDDFLLGIAQNHPTHAFLGKATQTVYLRQVALLREIAEQIFKKPLSEIRVLDWGSGKGHISYLLKKEGFQVTSCDRKDLTDDSSFGQETPILLEKSIPVVPLDQEVRLPFEDHSFEVVVSFGVLEHVQKDADSMREIRRILKPGGVFFVTFLPYSLSWTQRVAHLLGNDYHDRLYSKKKLCGLAGETGFNVLDIWHGQLFPKNSLGNSSRLEKLDRFLTDFTPLGLFATNLEAVLIKPFK